MNWQIALQLVRQQASNEPAVAGVQVAEPEEAQVEHAGVQVAEPEEARVEHANGSSEKVVGSETIADPVEHSSHGQATETSAEAGTVATDLPADQSQCPAAQPSDSEV
jgi:hypothetical protein